MSVRTLNVDLQWDIDTGPLSDVNDLTDEWKDNVNDATDSVGGMTEATSEFGEETNSTRSVVDRAGDSIRDNWNKIAVAIGGAGTAMEAFARQQQDLIESSDRLAYALGGTAEEAREMATSLADATFDLDDVYETMQIGRRQGLETMEQLRDFAEFWDMVADASQEDVTVLAEYSRGLRRVGIDAGQEGDALKAMGYIIEETNSTVHDYLRFMSRSGEEVQELGLDAEDTAVIMGILEREMGDGAREARENFRSAVRESEGDLEEFMNVLEITDEHLADHHELLAGSEPVVADLADIHAENRTVLQELQATLGSLAHRYGAELMPIIEVLSPMMMGLATVMGIMAGVKYLQLIPNTILATKAVWGFTASLLANPITWIVLLIVGLIAVIVLLWQNWDQVSEWFAGRWEWIKGVVGDVIDWLGSIDLVETGKAIIQGLIDGVLSMIGGIREAVSDVGNAIVDGVKGFFGISSPSRLMVEYGGYVGEGFNLGMEKEARGSMAEGLGYSPESDVVRQQHSSSFAPVVNISVDGGGGSEDVATAIDRRLRKTFDDYAERYFAKQRRRRFA